MATGQSGSVENSALLSETSEKYIGDESGHSDRKNESSELLTQSTSTSLVKTLANNRMTASSEGYQQRQHAYPERSGQPGGHPHAQLQFQIDSPPNSNPGYHGTNTLEMHDNETFDGSEDTPAQLGGPTVTCRVCDAEISLEGKITQHVVRCQQCNEVTPIRAAPPGKKYVRCPCNCLLVCKATSTRIACPRQNCRRVITLASGPPNSGIPGTAIRAPVGTCRVQCAYCQEIFMFNTLTNQLAICPHCRKSSSVGARHARSRSLLYFLTFVFVLFFLIGLIVAIAHGQDSFFMLAFLVALFCVCLFLGYRFIFFWRIKISQILGPL